MAGFFASLFHKKADASVSNPDEGAFVESPADDSRTASSQEEHLPTRIALCSPADGAAKSLEEGPTTYSPQRCSATVSP